MQRINCTVRLSGNINSTVDKRGITVAEAAVLRHIHGPESIVCIERCGVDDKIRHKTERDALAAKYPKYRHDIANRLFPGLSAKLPTTLEEAGFDVANPVDEPQTLAEPVAA